MRYPRESTKYKCMLLDITEIKNAKKLLIIEQKNIRKERKLLEREQSALNLAKNKAEKYKNEYKARIVKIKEQKDVYVKRKLEVSVEVRKLLTHKMTPLSILMALPAILIGFWLNFLMGAMITCMAFWTTRVYSISQFFYLVIVLLSGQFVPLQLMPPVVQTIAAYLPFQMFRFVPIEIILNRLPMDTMLRDYAFSLVWLVIFTLLFARVWREGVKHFSSVGA